MFEKGFLVFFSGVLSCLSNTTLDSYSGLKPFRERDSFMLLENDEPVILNESLTRSVVSLLSANNCCRVRLWKLIGGILLNSVGPLLCSIFNSKKLILSLYYEIFC